MKSMRPFQFALLALLASFALSGCNTIQGVGEDVQKVGEEVEDAAD